jgi:hypothetical protein
MVVEGDRGVKNRIRNISGSDFRRPFRRVAPLLIRTHNMRAKKRHVTWGSVRVREALVVRARPDRLAALYLDYRNWPELFPATIRGVRWLEEHDGDITVEVDHRAEGRVVNIIRPMSSTVIALEEFKSRYDATFVNRFEKVTQGTRYVLDAEIRFRLPYALVAPLLRGVVRHRLRQNVLEPMRVIAEAERPRVVRRQPAGLQGRLGAPGSAWRRDAHPPRSTS